MFLEFGEFVQEQQAVVGKGDLAGARGVPSSDEADVRDGVVGRAERTLGDERPVALQDSHDAVDLGGLDGLVEGHARQDAWNPPGKHGLAGTWRPYHQDIVYFWTN